MNQTNTCRVLHSFPHRLGAGRICYTAWNQVNGAARAGARVTVYPASLSRPVDPAVTVKPTLTWGRFKLPYRLFGRLRTIALHDKIVSRRLSGLAGQVDLIHAWPLGSLKTLKRARECGMVSVLERPNTHTRFGYEAVRAESDRIGVKLAPHDEHAFNPEVLEKEEEEYGLADYILCPSDFVAWTFLDQGFSPGKLLRHGYGFDETRFHPGDRVPNIKEGLRVTFVGLCAVVKGLHIGLEAWAQSSAARNGSFTIAGSFAPGYSECLKPWLTLPGVRVLGHQNNIAELLRESDVLIAPSITEGFSLVAAEAIGCGCVPLVSESCTESCRHLENALRHRVGDVPTLARQITQLDGDRALLEGLRLGALKSAPELTWAAAGTKLVSAYRQAISTGPANNAPVSSCDALVAVG